MFVISQVPDGEPKGSLLFFLKHGIVNKSGCYSCISRANYNCFSGDIL